MITPSFALTATERVLPRMALDFTTASLDSRVTFTRTGNTATVTNSSGYVVPINADLPRFDFNPTTLVCKGLLIEESRANLFLYSEDFSQAAWTKNNATVSSNSTNSPANTLTADTIVENTATSSHYTEQIVTFATGAISYSVYLKASTRTKVRLQISDLTISVIYVDADLSAGTVSSPVPGASWTNASATISAAANGFYRVTLTATASAGALKAPAIFLLDNSGNFSYTGNGTSGVFVWGAQIEAGAFPTSYIPTVASQVTRTADVASMTGSNFSSWYSAGAGGIVARVLPSTVSGTRPALQLDDATANEVIALRGNTTNPELVIVDGGSPQAQIDAGTIAANTAYNLGAAWNTDNCAAAVNGGAAVTDTSATIPTVTQARLGSDGTNYLNGNIQTLRYWPQRIINAEVQAFSK